MFVGRQYAAFAGITHGQKVHDFLEKLLVRRIVTPIELGSTGRTRLFHHHKPLYAALGERDNRNRRRVTIDRAIERLMVLDGVLADRSVTWLASAVVRDSGPTLVWRASLNRPTGPGVVMDAFVFRPALVL